MASVGPPEPTPLPPSATTSPLSPLHAAIMNSRTTSTQEFSLGIKVCVFCGSSPGKSPLHMEAARSLAHVFHQHNVSLVYGGGTVGLMGEVARTLVGLSGPEAVHGIIPAPLVKYERGPDSKDEEVSEEGTLPEYKIYRKTTVVKDTHNRKRMMVC
ncbi:uncharacterized protein PAC_14176 [Phialocephala subalpina]|uniref:Rossmann fold nucleotide-binding protein n=1 Tax=Phialocephala subalpina TaxID=576137 RepID=A0A1L7XGZ5_9HELO|nr:uncharacterized protein PAC_14176 [Phialocephala subalpina]